MKWILGVRGCLPSSRITYKKAGDGFLFYALCDTNGYLFQFFPFFDTQWVMNHFGMAKTFSAVVELLKHIPTTEEWHHVFMDNLYGNVKLAEHLLEMKFECTSTMRANRIPKGLKLNAKPAHNEFVSLFRNGVKVIKWMDKKEVRFCTTAQQHFPEMLIDKTMKRPVKDPVTGAYERKEVIEQVLNVAKDYNDNMNGVMCVISSGKFTTSS